MIDNGNKLYIRVNLKEMIMVVIQIAFVQIK